MAKELRVNPKDYRYPVDICMCWHHTLDHNDKGCTICGLCRRFRKPPPNQIITDKRIKIDKTIAEKMRELRSSNALLARKVEILEKCAEHYADVYVWRETQEDRASRDLNFVRENPLPITRRQYIGLDGGATIAQRALEAVKVGGEK